MIEDLDRPAAWSVPGDLVGSPGEWVEVVPLDDEFREYVATVWDRGWHCGVADVGTFSPTPNPHRLRDFAPVDKSLGECFVCGGGRGYRADGRIECRSCGAES